MHVMNNAIPAHCCLHAQTYTTHCKPGPLGRRSVFIPKELSVRLMFRVVLALGADIGVVVVVMVIAEVVVVVVAVASVVLVAALPVVRRCNEELAAHRFCKRCTSSPGHRGIIIVLLVRLFARSLVRRTGQPVSHTDRQTDRQTDGHTGEKRVATVTDGSPKTYPSSIVHETPNVAMS